MPYLQEYTKRKKEVLNLLLADEQLVRLLLNAEPKEMPAKYLIEQVMSNGELRDGVVHLYDYVPGTSSTAECHLCIDMDDDITLTQFVSKYYIVIDIFVPESLMNMYGAIRRDAIAARVDRVLNRATLGFGNLMRVPGGRYKPIQGWRQRTLVYEIKDWNTNYDDNP